MTTIMRNHLILWLLTIIIIGAGYYFSLIQLLDKEWFSRSGSLVVVLGIISGFSGIIEERIAISRINIEKRLAVIQKKRRLRQLKVQSDFIKEQLEDVEDQFSTMQNESSNAIKFKAGMIEGALLTLGTILWGFGDIALPYIL